MPVKVVIDDQRGLSSIFGVNDVNLKQVEEALGINIYPKNNELLLKGSESAEQIASNIFMDLSELAAQNVVIDTVRVQDVIETRKKDAGNGKCSEQKVEKIKLPKSGRYIVARTKAQSEYIKKIKTHDIVFSYGPAGTGKTYLAAAIAVTKLMEKEYDRIILTRPVVEAGENLGFLPGDFEAKISPYMRPLYDALNAMLPSELLTKYNEEGRIEIAPLAYMRGRTLSNSFIILDEAQNTSTAQMKMFLSRIGENSRAVLTGDLSQIDLPKYINCGLKDAVKRLGAIDGIAVHKFSKQDVVRHRLVKKILEAYDAEGGNDV